MEYTIKRLAELAGISSRTLRYYDEIGLLKPCRINSSGYRIYGQKEVDLLQQILLYRSMEMKLEDIQSIISKPDFDIHESLIEHHNKLISRKNQLEQLILTVEKTLDYNKGEIEMTNKQKFEGLKKEKLEENETKYGEEIRKKYGEETIKEFNKRFMNMSEENFKRMETIESEMFKSLDEVIKANDLDLKDAKNVYEKHKEWLSFSWSSYSGEAHVGLAEMYVEDGRFRNYYNDRCGSKAVTTLRDIIVKYAK